MLRRGFLKNYPNLRNINRTISINKISTIRMASSSPTSSISASTSSEWTTIDPTTDVEVPALYQLCISAVVPRPVAVITSVDPKSGVLNCAPYSYSSLAGHDPPIVTHGLTIGRATGKKDTLHNIEATGEWVFNVLTTDYLEQANGCAATLPIDQDETKLVGLDVLDDCSIVKVPRLKQSKVAMECKLIDKKEITNAEGRHTNTIVIGQVVKFHLHESILKDGQPKDQPRVDLLKLQAVGRAGDVTYWPVGTSEGAVQAMERPK
jgi:flavin reductase (DIM6/NTAB) family NADH-FMN oxidoreductase RutF